MTLNHGNRDVAMDAALPQRLRWHFLGVVLLVSLSSIASAQTAPKPLSPALKVTRLNGGEPIITKQMFLDVDPRLEYEAKNINGPCMVRIPDWVPHEDKVDPAAVYYLYFAHHGDPFIRMAWAAKIEGPYTLYNVHASDRDDDGMPGRGVLDLGKRMGKSGKPEMRFNKDFRILKNIASPDVIVDDANKRFIMFFHGHSHKPTYDSRVNNTSKQKTFVATSATGLNFNMPDGSDVVGGTGGGEPGHGIKVAHLGNAYFRTFTYAGEMYAFTNYGPIWKAPSATEPWRTSHLQDLKDDAWTEMSDKARNPISRNINASRAANRAKAIPGFARPTTASPRHFATLMQEDGHTLEVWYSARGDSPERIFRTTMDLSQNDWQTWETQVHNAKDVHQEMLRPECTWEGADLRITGGQNGQTGFAHAMRDPDLFRDADGKVYLFYVGGGESAIGVAQVHPAP